MQTLTIPQTDLTVSRLAYGCMRIANGPDPLASASLALDAALEMGFNFYDHADIYGGGRCEELFGEWLRQRPGVRERVVIASKCGILFAGNGGPEAPHRWDFSKDHILASADASLKRLGIEQIDLYQLHRPDLLANPAEIAEAFNILHESGKVRWFGVSNFRPSLLNAVQSAVRFPLVVNQVEISLLQRQSFEDGTLDQCLEKQIIPLSWSPLAQGRLGDGHTANGDAHLSWLLKVLDQEAAALGLTRAGAAISWLLEHPSKIIPIVGSTKPERLAELVKALDCPMGRNAWYRLFTAARGQRLP